MKLCEPGSIDKVRYLVKSGSHTFEVDEFHGENEGLVMAEVELQSEEDPISSDRKLQVIAVITMPI